MLIVVVLEIWVLEFVNVVINFIGNVIYYFNEINYYC